MPLTRRFADADVMKKSRESTPHPSGRNGSPRNISLLAGELREAAQRYGMYEPLDSGALACASVLSPESGRAEFQSGWLIPLSR